MVKTVAEVGEFGLISRIERIIHSLGKSIPELRIGLGDDAASVIPRAGYELVFTCDVLVEGRHYLPGCISPFTLGKRAMVVNTSDIGAMGGVPRYALVSLGLQADTPVSFVEELYQGLLAELNSYDAAIIGGNISKVEDAAFISITVIGEVPEGKAIQRSTARVGDAILVTGYPGQAAAGLRLLLKKGADEVLNDPLVTAYNSPVARVLEGRAIAESGAATAMIDISDGFLGDLGHICEMSRVGAILFQEQLPLSDELRRAAAELGTNPYDLFLGESDDYELIITCPPACIDRIRLAVAEVSEVPVTEVGRIADPKEGIRMVSIDGTQRQVLFKGWDHFAS